MKLSPAARNADRDLAEALLIGFDLDPTPITATDFAQILRDDGARCTNEEAYGALELLYQEGKIERDTMYCQKRKCTVNHYFGKDWDGKPRD